jgi:molybdopterin synthase sulfur carrier subunit
MKILYFAWLRLRIGIGEEDVVVPDTVVDVADLIKWLKTRGPGYAEALKDVSAIRVAVNQEFAEFETLIAQADEVALFPPMTGG